MRADNYSSTRGRAKWHDAKLSVRVKYWVRVLYTCCDVTQTWFKYLRGISNGFPEFITNRVLYPPIILLWSTAYTYLTLGRWERDTGALSALTDRAENRKEKTFSFSFLNRFCYPFYSKRWGFSLIVFGLQKYKQYLYVLALVSIAPRQGTCPHHQAYWLSAKKTPSIEKVFLITSQKLVLAQWSVQEEITFLIFDMCD